MIVQNGVHGLRKSVYSPGDLLPSAGLIGDISVAERLLRTTSDDQSLAPSSRAILVIGDSRITNISTDVVLGNPLIPWGGIVASQQPLANVAWSTGTYSVQARAGAVTPWGEIASLGSNNLSFVTTNGVQIPSGNDAVNRAFYNAAVTPNSTYARAEWQNKTVTVYMVFLAGPFGVTGEHFYISVRLGASVNATWRSASFGTYQASQGIKIVSCTIAARDWTDGQAIAIEVCGEQGYTPPANETLVLVDGPICSTQRGVTWCNRGVGGRWTEDYDNLTIWDFDAFFRGTGSLFSSWTLWIDLGSNGTGYGFRTIEQDEAYKRSMIAKFRKNVPDGDVILSCAHDGGGLPPCSSTWFRDANMRIAADSDRLLSIDSQNLFEPYFRALANGWFTLPDTVHLNATGRPFWAETVFAALRGASASTYRYKP